MNKFTDIEAFVAVVESNTFSAAGERLGITKSVVSRRISQLEKRLQTRLLNRTTRKLSLTDSGRHFYQRCLQILADLEDAEQSITTENTQLRGQIKLAAPLSFGLKHLNKAINEFLQLHPAIEISLDFNDRNINLVEEGFDMAVRIGNLEDSSLIAKKIGISRSLTCASDAYLQEHGEPSHPDDLSHHIGLQYSNISYKQGWSYLTDSNKSLQGQPHIRVRANNGDALAETAMAGLGLVSSPTFILGDYVRSGKLQQVLKNFKRPETGIYALFPPGRLLPQRVRVLADFLAEQFGDKPYWDEGL